MARKKKRNYKAEYKARIERALKKGYSRRIARGHAKRISVEGVDGEKRSIPVELGLRAAKRIKQRPGTLIEDLIKQDAIWQFGEAPRREVGDLTGSYYQLRLQELARRPGLFDWTDERKFVDTMKAIGLTERDAYTHWFSP